MKKIFYIPFLLLCFLFQVNTEVMGQCTGSYIFNSLAPAVTVTNGNAITFCESPSITIRLNGSQVGNWTVSGASISTSTNSITLFSQAAGLYAASVTIPASGNCVLGFTINIKDNPTGITFSAAPVPTIKLGVRDTIHLCPNITTTLSAACLSATCPINQNGYYWYRGNTSTLLTDSIQSVGVSSIIAAAPATELYIVKLINAEGCSTFDTVVVNKRDSAILGFGVSVATNSVSVRNSTITPTNPYNAQKSVCSERSILLGTRCLSGCGDTTALSYVWGGRGASLATGDSYGLQNNGLVNNDTITAFPNTNDTTAKDFIFIVTVTNSFGCISKKEDTVEVRPLWKGTYQVNPSPDICEGDPITLTSSCVSGCGGAVRYYWYDALQRGPAFTFSGAFNALTPTVVPTYQTATSTTTVTFTPTLPRDTISSIIYAKPDTLAIRLYVNNGYGCISLLTDASKQFINPLPVQIVAADSVYACPGQTTAFKTTVSLHPSYGTPAYTYLWATKAGTAATLSAGLPNTPNRTFNMPTNANLSAYNTVTYRPTTGLVCSSAVRGDSVIIADIAIALISDKASVCSGDSATISVTGLASTAPLNNYTYAWANNLKQEIRPVFDTIINIDSVVLTSVVIAPGPIYTTQNFTFPAGTKSSRHTSDGRFLSLTNNALTIPAITVSVGPSPNYTLSATTSPVFINDTFPPNNGSVTSTYPTTYTISSALIKYDTTTRKLTLAPRYLNYLVRNEVENPTNTVRVGLVSATTYTVTVTNTVAHCVNVVSKTIGTNPRPIVNIINPGVLCNNSNASVSVTATGGVGPYTYQYFRKRVQENFSQTCYEDVCYYPIYAQTISCTNPAQPTISYSPWPTTSTPSTTTASNFIQVASTAIESNGGTSFTNSYYSNIAPRGCLGGYRITRVTNSSNSDKYTNEYKVIAKDANGCRAEDTEIIDYADCKIQFIRTPQKAIYCNTDIFTIEVDTFTLPSAVWNVCTVSTDNPSTCTRRDPSKPYSTALNLNYQWTLSGGATQDSFPGYGGKIQVSGVNGSLSDQDISVLVSKVGEKVSITRASNDTYIRDRTPSGTTVTKSSQSATFTGNGLINYNPAATQILMRPGSDLATHVDIKRNSIITFTLASLTPLTGTPKVYFDGIPGKTSYTFTGSSPYTIPVEIPCVNMQKGKVVIELPSGTQVSTPDFLTIEGTDGAPFTLNSTLPSQISATTTSIILSGNNFRPSIVASLIQKNPTCVATGGVIQVQIPSSTSQQIRPQYTGSFDFSEGQENVPAGGGTVTFSGGTVSKYDGNINATISFSVPSFSVTIDANGNITSANPTGGATGLSRSSADVNGTQNITYSITNETVTFNKTGGQNYPTATGRVSISDRTLNYTIPAENRFPNVVFTSANGVITSITTTGSSQTVNIPFSLDGSPIAITLNNTAGGNGAPLLTALNSVTPTWVTEPVITQALATNIFHSAPVNTDLTITPTTITGPSFSRQVYPTVTAFSVFGTLPALTQITSNKIEYNTINACPATTTGTYPSVPMGGYNITNATIDFNKESITSIVVPSGNWSTIGETKRYDNVGPRRVTHWGISDYFNNTTARPLTIPNNSYTSNNIGDASHLGIVGAATITSGAVCLYEQGDLGDNDFKDSIRVHISPFILNNPSKPSGANIVQGAYKLNVAEVIATASVSQDTICAKDTTILFAVGTSEGSTNGITYQWRTDAVTATPITTQSVLLNPDSSRTYVLTVTDAFGCKDIDSVYVLVNKLPGTRISPNNTAGIVKYCPNSSIALFANADNIICNSSGNCAYTWDIISGVTPTTISTTNSINRNTEETLRLTIVANGCEDYDTVIIAKQTPPTVRITNSPATTGSLASLCIGVSDTLYIDSVSAGQTPCVGCFYRWNTNATQPTLIVNSPGGYYVQVTDTNGCIGISNPLMLTLAASGYQPTITADPSQICNGQVAILEATPCVGCKYTFYEDGATSVRQLTSTNPSLRTIATGIVGDYFVDVKNPQGCVYRSVNNASVTSITIASPIISTNTNTLCGNDTVTLLTAYNASHTYQWHRDGVVLSAETNSQLQTTLLGQYHLVVGYPNGCMGVSNTITVGSGVIQPSITALPDNTNTICSGDFITLSTTLLPNSTYQWYRNGIMIAGAVGASHDATISGTYHVLVRQPNGCVANSPTRTLTVSNVTNPIASANQFDFCPNDSVRLAVSLCPGCSYQWYRNGVSITQSSTNNYFIYKKQAGIYSARVASAGCVKVSNDVVVTEKPVPVPSITTAVTELCNGVTPILRTNSCVGCTYTWMKNINNIFYPIFGAPNDTVYAVNVVDTFAIKVNYPNGCTDTSAQQVIITGSYNVYLDKDTMVGMTLINPDTTCNGSLKTFTLTLSSPSKCSGGCNYEWFKDGSLVSAGPFDTYTTNQPGVLQVRVTTSNGCVAVSNIDTLVQVTLSPVISGTATALCAFSPTTLTVSSCVGCSYVWSNSPPVTIVGSTSVVVNSAGSYQVTAVRGACSAVATPYILNNLPGINPVIAATSNSICAGDSVQINLISGCSACTFQWLRDTAVATPPFPVLAATLPNYATNLFGDYAVIVRDTSNNCIDTSNFVQLNAVNPAAGFQLTFTNVSVLPTNAPKIFLDTAGLFPISLRGGAGRYISTPLFVPVNPDTSLSTNVRRDTFFPQRAEPGNYQITYQYTASGCTFSASSIIKILDEATISVTNTYISAPSYEACVGDTLLVRTDNFPFAIDTIFVLDQNDNYVTVSLFSHTATIASFSGTNIYRDSIRFVVPDWAKACFVKVKGTSAATKFTQFVQIHNAPLSLSGLPNTVCSNGAPIALTGTPSGGTFIFQSSPSFPSTTTIPGVFTGNILDPSAIPIFPVSAYDSAGIIDSARVIYQYISNYTNLAACRIPDTVTQKVVARAVTLTSVRYNRISASQTTEKLDNLVAQVIPYTATPSRWLLPGTVARGHAIRYSGSFTSPAGNPVNFLPQNAGVGPSNLNYTIINGVCENTVSNDITVLPLPSLVPIADTICRNTAPVVFGRDPILPYSTAFLNVGAGVTYRDTIHAIRVQTAASNAYLTTLNPNPNLESYRYQPLLTPHTNRDTIRIDYVFRRTEYNGTVSYNSVTYTVASSVQPIYIEDTIATSIKDSLLSRVYCEGNTDYLAVGVPSGGVFSLQGGTGVYNTNSLLVNNIINPTAIHQNETTNTSYTLTYNVQGAACQSQDTFQFLIPEPLDPSFHTLSGLTEYCNSALPDSIVRHTPNYGAVHSTILVNGVAQPGIKFTPTFQIPGQQIITHQLTDTLYGCVTSSTDTFQVYALPIVSVSNITTTEYCTNDSSFQFTISPSPVCAGATGGEVIREGFDLPQLPNGWQFANLAPASSGWSQGFVGGYGVAIVDTTSVPQNTWMYTSPVAMVAGGTYQIEYWLRVSARQCLTCSDASMKVTVGQGQTPLAQSAILADFPTLDDNYAGFFTRQSHSFIAPAAGNFNFAFHAYSSGNTVRRITLDTVIVRQISAANCQNGIGAITGAGIASIPGQDSVFRFVPTSVAAGQHTIRYIFSDTRSCIDSVVIPITMKPHPTVSIASLSPTYCDNAPAVPLSGAPVGGTFSVTRWTGIGNSNVYIGSSVLAYNVVTDTTGSTTYNTSVQLNFLPRVVGTQLHTYRYRDPITQCATSAFDTVTVVDIPDSVVISTLDTAYCEYAAPVTLSTASIRGGAVTGHFYGAGVVNGALGAGVATLDFPAAVAAQGRNGDDLITYAYVASNGCLDTTRFTTRINDRPRLSFDLVPANFRLPDSVCQNAIGRPIRVNWQQWDGALGNILIDSMIPFGAGQLLSPIISPVGDSLNPDTTMLGWYPVQYSFTNVYGCLDTIRDSVRVDTFPDIYFAGLPTSRYYCENEAGGLLLANPAYYPGAGYLRIYNHKDTANTPATYYNLNDSLTLDSSFYFITPSNLANLNGDTAFYYLLYNFTDLRGCNNTGRDSFQIRSYPRISFSMPSVFCNAADTVSLRPYVSLGNPTGGFGVFSDNLPYTAIVRDSLLNLNITGPRVLTYFYQSTVTQCSNTDTTNITVYHTPSVDFVANGGCTGVSVEFVPSLSNLDIAFDSITQVIWTYSPGNSATISPSTPTTLANNYYSYGTDGYFNPVLSVINRGICAATVTHPLIVSPTVVLNRWGAPYVEDFQTTVSRPSWYPEQVTAISVAPNDSVYLHPDITWTREMLDVPALNIYDAETPSNKAWVTYGRPGINPHSYRAGSRANVYSPCFDFTNTWRPMISMDVWKDMQEGIDGAVLEYYHDTSRTWRVLGALNEGIGWYNSDFLLSRPGAQLNSSTLTPTGWTGESDTWENARFRLDQFAGRPSIRFRVAFAAAQNSINPNLPTNQQLQGFAFDSVWIGERGRNVLVEHFTNYNYPNVNTIDQGLYNKIFTNINGRDVSLIQYNTGHSSPSDQLFIFDSVDVNVRRLYYGIDDDNRAIVDGTRRGDGTTENLSLNELDYDMLQFPAFDIFLNPLTVQQTATGYDVTVGGSILANRVMPQRDYRFRTVIVEDSILSQPDPSGSIPTYNTMSVMRRALPNAAGIAYNNGFWLGQSLGMPSQTYSIPVPAGTTVNPARLSAVVYIQDEVDKDVYQVATTRDLTIYAYDRLTGVSPIEPTTTAETASCRLYPNPTVDNFTVDFEKPLISEHRWKVIDILGQVVEEGQAQAGTQQIQVNTQKLAPASYFFVIENGRTYTQRQVVIYKP